MDRNTTMKEYNFEYTDTNYILKIFGITALIFACLMILTFIFIKSLGVIIALIISFSIPILFFWVKKRGFRKEGSAIIQDSFTDLNLSTFNRRVDFNGIQNYQIENFEGTKLRIKFKDSREFKILANSNFCDPLGFDIYCKSLDEVLRKYNDANANEIIKEKSFFERKWVLPVLLILTATSLLSIIYAIIKGVSVPVILFGTLAILLPLWVGYFNATKNKK
ncbi:hypothetical protein QYS49_39585 [Marivirga salinae]|uniref:Uncharacterized protein n=1 Tax=Marivirga salinarum TaxID=3059078 RepID=A0AA51RB29_9BACT|nr:hypothetical protein [Marivirga sp. BDSF4-3]WMN11776.1 hypothetical protein QYS49_39585 [Marivirga sp. BDSF4-3]